MKFMQYYLGKWIFNFVFLIGVAVLNLPNVLTISRIVVILSLIHISEPTRP